MELSVEPLTFPFAIDDWANCADSLREWDEAYRRVEAYFSALHVDNKLLLSSLVLKILGRASERAETEPDRRPVELAAEETDRHLVEWFRRVLGEEGIEKDDRLSARGRLALLQVESDVPWQQLFLTDEPVPDDVAEAMRTAYLHADPDFRFVKMRPRPIDLGIVDVANRTIEGMGPSRAALPWILWTIFGIILATIFFLTR